MWKLLILADECRSKTWDVPNVFAHVHVHMCVHACCVHACERGEYLTLGDFVFKDQGPNLSFQVHTHVCTDRQCREDTFLVCIAMGTIHLTSRFVQMDGATEGIATYPCIMDNL